MMTPVRIAVIPDIQARPGDDFGFLGWIGMYLVKMKPDVIVQLGDFADLPSLSTHDKAGSKGMEGKRYKEDIKAAKEAMQVLMEPVLSEQERQRRNKEKVWKPKMVLTLGNHEDRINRAINNDPRLEGLISIDDLDYKAYGWETVPFLEPTVIHGIAFCHYFVSGVMGRPCTSAAALIQKHHMSCFAGHQQGRNIAYGHAADGREITSIISGSCYEHNEAYLNPQTNRHWKGMWMLMDVVDGSFDEIPVSLRYLRRKYNDGR